MLEKLKQLDNKYNEIQQRMESGEIFADPSAYTNAPRSSRSLSPLCSATVSIVLAESR